MIDLRSDTVTRPTRAMKKAMLDAPLGDDVFRDDPTINRLEAVAAERSGKEAAIYVPSGTMSNQIALAVHTRRGDAVICEARCHIYNWEAAAAPIISGVLLRPVHADRGLLTPEQLRNALTADDPHCAPTSLFTAEDTHNAAGGLVAHPPSLLAVAAEAHALGLSTHLDGARVFNAAVAAGHTLAERLEGYDTASICLSKGLGAPVGSLLVGPADLIHRARYVRKLLGGGMRQAGLLAAAGLHALEHHVDRLADDHARATALAEGLIALGLPARMPETNLVYVDVDDPTRWAASLKSHGVLVAGSGRSSLRAVTHLDVDDDDLRNTLAAFKAVLDV